MEEKQITERESIELIAAMVSRTKERYIGDGNIMLMWGYLVVAVAVTIWILLVSTGNPAWNWLWFAIWIVGGSVTPVMARKKQIREGVKSYSDAVTSRIWSAIGYAAIVSTLFCLGFLLFRGIDTWKMMFAFALVMVPFAEIAQGIIIKEKSIVAGGAIGLTAGIFTMCCIAGNVALHASWFMPIFIVAFAAMMILPGHILNYKAKHQ